MVHLEVQRWSGKLAGANARASDVFTLLNCNGEWKITHKLFHWHDQDSTARSERGLHGWTGDVASSLEIVFGDINVSLETARELTRHKFVLQLHFV